MHWRGRRMKGEGKTTETDEEDSTGKGEEEERLEYKVTEKE